MAKAIIGNASAITVPRQDRDSIRRFYCDVLGGKIVKEDNEKDNSLLQMCSESGTHHTLATR